jgi:arsenite-transporting ATPase
MAQEAQALSEIPENLAALPRTQLVLKPFNLMGVDALRLLFEPLSSIALESHRSDLGDIDFPPLSTLVSELSQQGHGLVMMMGKGGVGKTTVAASVAVALAQAGHKVHLSTSDPAAHLSYTLAGALENLEVSRIDPKVETDKYRQFVLENQGKGLDAEGLAVLEEDLRSPCTEEIAVFQAFSRIIKQADEHFVIMDTAPTGHTLLLLDATGAYHREMVRQMGQNGESVVTPMRQLQDPNKTKVIIVTLAETTPVLEAANLQTDLRRAKIEPWAWVINNSLAAAIPRSPFLITRANREIPLIKDVEKVYAHRVAVIPQQYKEPVGVIQLAKLAD